MRKLLGLFVAAVGAPVLTLMYSTGGLLSPSEVVDNSSENQTIEIAIPTSNLTESKKKKANKKQSKESNKAKPQPKPKENKKEPEKKQTTGYTSTVQEESYRPPRFAYRFL